MRESLRPKMAPTYHIRCAARPDRCIEINDPDEARSVYRDLKRTFPARGYELRVVYWRRLAS